MNNKALILNELKEIAPELCTINTSMPFSIPNNYFEQFSLKIQLTLQEEITQQKQVAYSVPNNYFDSLSNAILNKVKSSPLVERSPVQEELELIAPFLNTLERKDIYEVPIGYFENLKPSYFTDDQVEPKAKVVPIKTKWFNTAIAASIITIVFISSVLFNGNDNKFDYDAYNKIDVKKGLNKVNDIELERFLVNDNVIINSDVVSSLEGEVPDLDERLKITTDEELQQYLKQMETISIKSGI